MPPKRSKYLNQRRNRRELSKSVKDFGGYDAGRHLGDKKKHDVDAAKQREWMQAKRAKKLGVNAEDLDQNLVVDQALSESGGTGSRSDDEKTGRELKAEKEIHDLLGDSGLLMAMAFVGEPGLREWKDLEGDDWVFAMMEEKRHRANYRTTQKAVENGPKALQVMLARLKPWTALELGESLLGDPERLRQRIKRLIAAFEKRYNVDVVGVVAHRESSHDLHLHLVFSQTREVVIKKASTVREINARKKLLVAQVRAELKTAGKPATNKLVSEEVSRRVVAGVVADPSSEKMFVENRRFRNKDETVHRNAMGHSFRSKLQIWRSALPADKEAVASLHDNPASDPYSFRGRMVAPELAGEKLEEFWWDLWTAEEWDRVCREDFTPELLKKVDDRGSLMAQDFARYGSTLPTLSERLAVEKGKAETQIQTLNQEILGLKSVVETAESSIQSMLDLVPVNLLCGTATETISNLVSEMKTLGDERENTRELVELGKVLSEHMRSDAEPEKWTSESASLPENARSFLDWITKEPRRLMDRFRQFVEPLTLQLLKMPKAWPLLEFLGIPLPKEIENPSGQVGGSNDDVEIN